MLTTPTGQGTGRPTRKNDEKFISNVTFICKQEQKDEIVKRARENYMSISEFCRSIILDRLEQLRNEE